MRFRQMAFLEDMNFKEMQENFLQNKFQPFVDNDLQRDSTVSHLNIFFFIISKSF